MAFKTNPRDTFSKSKLVSGFNNNDTLAQYDPRSQVITLNSYQREEVERLKNADDAKQREFAAVVIHEFTHWIDHVSSLWGQQNLLVWFKGLAAWKDNDPTHFPAVLAARQAMKSTKYAQYYATIETSDADGARQDIPWQYLFTAGRAFDLQGRPNIEHPILFTRFATRSRKKVGRVPISPGALLELNAIAADLFFDMLHYQEAVEAGEPVESEIRKKDIGAKYMNILYSPELVEYSVAAHCLGNTVKDVGIFAAYGMAARLSEVAMNLSPDLFELIRLPNNGEPFASLHPYFLRRKDVGYAYWCLCQNADDDVGEDMDKWAENALSKSGLPDQATIKKEAQSEMKKLRHEIPTGDLGGRLRELAEYGSSVFDKYGMERIRNIYQIYHDADEVGKFPMLLLGDDTVMGNNHGWSTWSADKIEEWCNSMWDFDTWSETFESACVP